MANKGDVVLVNENVEDWRGCLMIVSEVNTQGVVAGMKIPFKGIAYMRLRHEDYEVIGPAVFVERGEDD